MIKQSAFFLLRSRLAAMAMLLTLIFTLSLHAETKLKSALLENDLCFIELSSTDHPAEQWTIQSSTNLEDWEDITTLTLQNGYAQTTVAVPAKSTDLVFFRAFYLETNVEATLQLPEIPYNYANIQLPDHLTTNGVRREDNTPANNPVTDNGATLGRVLFYDKKLSQNETISCSSCHFQENGFSDPRQFSIGFEGGATGRNSMGLSSAAFYEREHFFWDERADTLEDQTLMPIQDPIEMGMDLDSLVARLQSHEYYEPLFTAAFGDETITSQRISLALSQFIRSMVSYQSKYDVGETTGFTNFTNQENQGRQLFNSNQTRCNDCHEGPNFVGDAIRNNGLEFPFVDRGVGGVTGDDDDDGKFKMSSLRNIEVTGPYMHDGRFETLEEVIEHYHDGIVANPNLGNELENMRNQPDQGNFTDAEKAALIAFLKTLTDHTFLNDEKFSDPFVSN